MIRLVGSSGRGCTPYPISARPTERRGVFNVTEMEVIPEVGEDSGETVNEGDPLDRYLGKYYGCLGST